ncbi:MAG: TIGR00269 family protein [Candidatus Nanoarchaeia archaeon]
MMDCEKCERKAVFDEPSLCKVHFLEYFEAKVEKTINEHKLLEKDEKICVAVSGGKDSLSVLFVLDKLGYDVSGLFIDEGIANYREFTEKDLVSFCNNNKIKLRTVRYKEELGKGLDEILTKHKDWKPCTVCGTFRRSLLNKHARGFDKIATGHNLDDEAQAILMNLLRSNTDFLARLGPKSGVKEQKGFVQRVKPLYFCTEKETAAFSFLNGFTTHFAECPYVVEAFRADVRDLLNGYESVHHGTKKNIINHFLKMMPDLKVDGQELEACESCGQPSAGEICNACKLVDRL